MSWFALTVISKRYTHVCFLCTWPLTVLGFSDCSPPAPTSACSPGLCLLAACPDISPGIRLCLCLASAVLPCMYFTLYCMTILNKICNWIQTLLTCHNRRLRQTVIQQHYSTELTAQASQLAMHQHQLNRLTILTEELVKALQGLRILSPEVAAHQLPICSSSPTAQTPPNQSTTSFLRIIWWWTRQMHRLPTPELAFC